MAEKKYKYIDRVIVVIIIIVLIVIIGTLIHRIGNEIKNDDEVSEVPVIRIKPENKNNKEKNSDNKEQFKDTSQDYLTEGYKKKIIEICKSTAPTKT